MMFTDEALTLLDSWDRELPFGASDVTETGEFTNSNFKGSHTRQEIGDIFYNTLIKKGVSESDLKPFIDYAWFEPSSLSTFLKKTLALIATASLMGCVATPLTPDQLSCYNLINSEITTLVESQLILIARQNNTTPIDLLERYATSTKTCSYHEFKLWLDNQDSLD